MEAASHGCAAEEVFLNLLAKSLNNTCKGVQLHPTAFIFIKNEFFHGYFLRILLKILVHFYDLIAI